MKAVDIYVEGHYDYKFKSCKCVYYLAYKDAVIKDSKDVLENGSPVRASLYAIYFALQRIHEPCIINIFSKQKLGFDNPKKSVNKDLLVKIQTVINKAGHLINIDDNADFYKVIMWEQVYGTPINHNKDYSNIKSPNDVFEIPKENKEEDTKNEELEKERLIEQEWKEILNDRNSAWTPGSGGY